MIQSVQLAIKWTTTKWIGRGAPTLVLCAAILSACSGIESRKLGPTEVLRPGDGFPVTMTKLEARLQRTVDAGRSAYRVSLVPVPDPMQRWTIRPVPGPLADIDLTLQIGGSGEPTNVDVEVTDRTVAIIGAIGRIATVVAPFLDANTGWRRTLSDAWERAACDAAIVSRLDERAAAILTVDRFALFGNAKTEIDLLAELFTFLDLDEQKCILNAANAIDTEWQAVRQKPDLNEAEKKSWKLLLNELKPFLISVASQTSSQRLARLVLLTTQDIKIAQLDAALRNQDPRLDKKIAELRRKLALLIGRPDLREKIEQVSRELERFPRAASGGASAYASYGDARTQAAALESEFDEAVGTILAALDAPVTKPFDDRSVPIVAASCLKLKKDPPAKDQVQLDPSCLYGGAEPEYLVVIRNPDQSMPAEEGTR